MHDSGTGGASSLGNYQALPMTCKFGECSMNKVQRLVPQRRDVSQLPHTTTNVTAARSSPGWFAIQLENGVDVETTATDHVVLHRFDYSRFLGKEESYIFAPNGGRAKNATNPPPPSNATSSTSKGSRAPVAGDKEPVLLFDLSSDLDRGSTNTHARVQSVSAGGGAKWNTTTLTGSGLFQPSFGTGHYDLYTCVSVPGVAAYRLVEGGTAKAEGISELRAGWDDSGVFYRIADEYLAANDNVAVMRIGVSWQSADKACKYAQEEMPDYESKAGFDRVLNEGREIWNKKLSPIDLNVTGISEDNLVNFHSSLYRNFLAPISQYKVHTSWRAHC